MAQPYRAADAVFASTVSSIRQFDDCVASMVCVSRRAQTNFSSACEDKTKKSSMREATEAP